MSKDYAEINTLMELYFEGLYQADSAMLRRVFHPNLAYVCATKGDPLYLDLETYMARIDKRVAPAQSADPRDETVLDISIGTPEMAKVTARMMLMGRSYLDFLTLLKTDQGWRVISKIFAYEPLKG